MKKTMLTLALLCGMLLIVTAVPAEAATVDSGTCGDNLTWTLDDQGTLTISGTGEMNNYTYPYYVPWYTNKNFIQTVSIASGVKSIGDYAFYNCSSLTSISIPENVTSIGDYAFYNCSSLTSISIPEDVTSIGDYAFYNCSRLTSITIPSSMTSIGSDAFSGCTKLNEIHIDSIASWLSINYQNYSSHPNYNSSTCHLYIGNNEVTSITIPEGVTSIGDHALRNCSSLTSITIPSSVSSIGSSAFRNCSSLTNITIPSHVTSIGSSTFRNCSSLTSITIPEGVTSIGADAFEECSNLTSITIPESVTSIGGCAFYGCRKLNKIHIDSIESWLSIDYKDNYSHPNYDSSACHLYIGNYEVTSITIPVGMTSICDYAFRYCSSLASITIPASVTSIGFDAFCWCTNLNEIHIDSIESWLSIDFQNFDSHPNYLSSSPHLYIGNNEVTSVTIPEGMTSIVDQAFSGFGSLTSITIPEGVTSIGDQAFAECINLMSIMIPKGVTSIGAYAFRNCTSLTSIMIPEGVTSIGDGAFDRCSSLTSITIPVGVTSIGDAAFYNCSSLTSITIPEGVTSIGSYAFSSCTSLTSITIPEGVTSIGNTAFYNCISLTRITIPEGVTSIGDTAFNNCISLTSITIPEGVTSIGNYTFTNCSSLTSITIPEGVTSIGDDAFFYCTALTGITIPESVTSIGMEAFYNCRSLTSITIPEGVTSISEFTFCDCIALTGILLPNSVTAIGESPFPLSTKVYCYEFSFAEAWANDNGYQVELVDAEYLEDALTVSLPAARSVMAGSVSGMGETVFPRVPELEIAWTSSDPSVAEITRDGILYALKGGKTTVTLTAGGKTASCVVTVVQGAESFALPEDIYVVAKLTAQTEVIGVTPADATLELSWTTGNSVYAEVSQTGLVTGKAVGTTTLTVTDAVSGLSRTANLHICYPVTAVALELSAESVFVGQTAQATATVTARDQTCVNQLVTFSVSNSSIVSIDRQGRIKALKPGTVTVTARAASGKSAACQLIVKAFQLILSLPQNLTHISAQAFLNLTAADAVRIPGTVSSIAWDAFDGADVIILAPAGSYAAQWALEHGLTVIEE